MRKVILWGTIASGAIAAYLMYKRGVPVGSIAGKAVVHPISSLISELRNA